MNKKLILLTVALIFGALCAQCTDVSKLPRIHSDGTLFGKNESNQADVNSGDIYDDNSSSESKKFQLDKDTVYYPKANLKSAISKYKAGNYAGCLQELFSLTKKDPSNSVAYYYMAMSYTHLDMKDDAVEAYEKVLALHPNKYLAEYAIKGRDCLTNGPACQENEADDSGKVDELDRFIKAPYGNGLSPELNSEVKQKQLNNFRQTINQKEQLENNDIQKIKEFDKKNSKSSIEENDKIAQVSDEEVLNAIETLKKAGVNVTVGQESNPYAQFAQYQDPQLAELSMMLGGNNNNNNSMMNMVPLLMSQSQQGKNVDPRLMQAMLMNSMMSDMSFGNNNNNRY